MPSEHQVTSPPARGVADFRALLEAISEIVCIVDQHGAIRYLNTAAAAALGNGAGDCIGLPAWHLAHPEEAEEVRRWLERRLRGEGGAGEVLEFRVRRNDGAWRILEARADCHHLDSTPALALFARDLTEQRRLEERLRQAQRLEAAGLLASGIAHDFNNLLIGIKGYAELLLHDPTLREPHRRDVDEIGKAAHQASGLTRQLLAFVRRQTIEPERIDPAAVLADLERLLELLVDEKIELRTAIQRQSGCIEADRSQFEQIVINLVINARDAMPEGGLLTLELDELTLDEPGACKYQPLPPGRYVRLRVSDTGRGMDEETRRRIFEPFFTTKGPDGGTGLGLSNVQEIVQRCGGAIVVESAPGSGATFHVLLPRDEDRR